jgi:hypothetical protein
MNILLSSLYLQVWKRPNFNQCDRFATVQRFHPMLSRQWEVGKSVEPAELRRYTRPLLSQGLWNFHGSSDRSNLWQSNCSVLCIGFQFNVVLKLLLNLSKRSKYVFRCINCWGLKILTVLGNTGRLAVKVCVGAENGYSWVHTFVLHSRGDIPLDLHRYLHSYFLCLGEQNPSSLFPGVLGFLGLNLTLKWKDTIWKPSWNPQFFFWLYNNIDLRFSDQALRVIDTASSNFVVASVYKGLELSSWKLRELAKI